MPTDWGKAIGGFADSFTNTYTLFQKLALEKRRQKMEEEIAQINAERGKSYSDYYDEQAKAKAFERTTTEKELRRAEEGEMLKESPYFTKEAEEGASLEEIKSVLNLPQVEDISLARARKDVQQSTGLRQVIETVLKKMYPDGLPPDIDLDAMTEALQSKEGGKLMTGMLKPPTTTGSERDDARIKELEAKKARGEKLTTEEQSDYDRIVIRGKTGLSAGERARKELGEGGLNLREREFEWRQRVQDKAEEKQNKVEELANRRLISANNLALIGRAIQRIKAEHETKFKDAITNGLPLPVIDFSEIDQYLENIETATPELPGVTKPARPPLGQLIPPRR